MKQVAWTLVTRTHRGRYLHPVPDVPEGLTWHEAVALAQSLVSMRHDLDVWYVPDRKSQAEGWAEDRDNVLLDTGRRIPIRWDSKPQTSILSSGALEDLVFKILNS